MNKRVLVTGGAGFIGSHVCEMYVAGGYDVLCVDNLTSGKVGNLQGLMGHTHFQFVKEDICNLVGMRYLFETFQPHIVNHHAAQKSVVASLENPMDDLDTNLNGLLMLLACIKKHPIEKFIYVSSGGALSKVIVGDEKSKESDMPQLISPYAITKYAGENYVTIYAKAYDFDYTVLRYANIYGPRQIPDGECGVVPIFVNNILANQPSVLMTYPDMPRGCTRDYVFVGDVVEANRLASEKATNTVLNIGTGQEIAILDIYQAILNTFDKEVPIMMEGPRIGDVKRSVLSNDRAKKILAWDPRTSLEEGLLSLKKAIRARS
ncbi:NAD-dependent epimerase/dehydratase family protein [Listeria booriae]|uniref:NAD-dependent epimerase/dehydratase family protein n=1 Tax=Listeria booriae TaxID=1552123 RepID=UPI001628DEC7|nr:NAD-dependent epimerase/dehydratase family protein [Listeria booriae]MBC1272367.1 NAD-dependent epimerase/dehydratase family protein [Listeria booriae]